MALNVAVRLWLPQEAAVRLPWLLPAVEAVLLVALVVGNPSRLAGRTRWVHRIAVTLVVVLVAAALWATVILVYDLIKGHGVTNSPTAKYIMLVQSTVALALFGLIVARAVNAFT